MNPQIDKPVEDGDTMTFTLSGVNVSIANSIRRTILSDIKTVVFKTTPYEENKCKIIENTTRFNNEILKQRLSCVPIHISDLEMPIQNYLMELKMENTTIPFVILMWLRQLEEHFTDNLPKAKALTGMITEDTVTHNKSLQ